MASREEDIALIAGRMREQMLGNLPPDQRAAREAQLNAALRQRDTIVANGISPDSEVPEEVRNLRAFLRQGQATLRVPEGTPPELAEAMQRQFAAGRNPQKPAQQQDYFTQMATQLYDNPVTRAAFLGSEQEQAAAIGAEAARQRANVARQMEALGQRPVQGKPDAGAVAMEEQVRRLPNVQGAGRQPEVAGMMAALQALQQAGPEMARRLPGVIAGAMSGNSEYARPEPRPQRGPNDVPHIDGTRMGFSIPGRDPAHLAAATATVRANLQRHVQSGDSSPGAQAVTQAQELILRMNAQSMGGPAMSRQKTRE